MKKIELSSLLFELIFDEEKEGITAISIVDNPAILTNFMCFSKEIEALKFAVDTDQKIITGPVIIPNVKIFRSAKSLGLDQDAYVYFKEDTIRKLAENFLAKLKNNENTLDHEEKTTDLTLRESWIIEDSEKDKASFLGFDLPIGTWMASYKVNNDNLWEEIKAGDYKGYSIEAALNLVPKGEVNLSIEEDRRTVIPDEMVPHFLNRLKETGQREVDLDKEGYILIAIDDVLTEDVELMAITLAITSDPNEDSTIDKGKYAFRYRYKGPRDDKNRTFCAEVLDANLLYRKEDINQMSFRTENKDFGTYSIFKYKGSYNCRHSWERLTYLKIEDNVTPIKVTGVPEGIEPNDEQATEVNPKVVK